MTTRYPSEHWWQRSDDEIPSSVYAAVKYLHDSQMVRDTANLHHLRLYSNRAALGLSGKEFAEAQVSDERIRMNVVKSCIDSAVAQIATNRPSPMYKTIKGDYALRKRAEKLGKFVKGQFYALQQYILSLDIFLDACVFGSGIEQVTEDSGKILIERVLPSELYIDDNDGRLRKPTQYFRHKEVTCEVLQHIWGMDEDEARAASFIKEESSSRSDLIVQKSIVEAFHLPTNKDSDDGRHIICTSNKLLFSESWTRDKPSYAVFRWNHSPLGYWGIGLAEELSSIQVEINYIAQKIQRLMTLATTVVWKEKGSMSRKLSNRDMEEYEFTGRPPIFQQIASVSAEYFAHLDRLYQRAYEIAGISQLAAQSQKPAGLDSGEALRVYNDIGTKRFQHVAQRWEQFHLDVSELLLDCARDIEERGDGDLKVLAQGDKDVEELNFSEVSIEKDKYTVQCWPNSLLPDTPAGKIEALQKLAQVSPDLGPYVLGLMTGIPDLEYAVAQANAPVEIAEKMVDAIISDGDYNPPYPTMNLQLARDIATRAQLRAVIDGVPEDRIELLMRYISEIDKLVQMAMPKQMPIVPQPVGPAPMPGAMPPMPPTLGGPPPMGPMGAPQPPLS